MGASLPGSTGCVKGQMHSLPHSKQEEAEQTEYASGWGNDGENGTNLERGTPSGGKERVETCSLHICCGVC